MIFYNPLLRPVLHFTFLPPHSLWLVEAGKVVIIRKHPLSALSSDSGDGTDLCRKQKLTADEVILEPSVVIYWLMKWRFALPSLSIICCFFSTYIKCSWPLLELSVTVSRWLSKHSSPLANVKSPNSVWPSLKNITIETVLQYLITNSLPAAGMLAVKDKITQHIQQAWIKLEFMAERIEGGSDAAPKEQSRVTSPSLLLSSIAIHHPWLWIPSLFSFFNARSFLLMSEIKISVLEILQLICGNPTITLLVGSYLISGASHWPHAPYIGS